MIWHQLGSSGKTLGRVRDGLWEVSGGTLAGLWVEPPRLWQPCGSPRTPEKSLAGLWEVSEKSMGSLSDISGRSLGGLGGALVSSRSPERSPERSRFWSDLGPRMTQVQILVQNDLQSIPQKDLQKDLQNVPILARFWSDVGPILEALLGSPKPNFFQVVKI